MKYICTLPVKIINSQLGTIEINKDQIVHFKNITEIQGHNVLSVAEFIVDDVLRSLELDTFMLCFKEYIDNPKQITLSETACGITVDQDEIFIPLPHEEPIIPMKTITKTVKLKVGKVAEATLPKTKRPYTKKTT